MFVFAFARPEKEGLYGDMQERREILCMMMILEQPSKTRRVYEFHHGSFWLVLVVLDYYWHVPAE
jgi:hypothetical protein